MIFFPTLCGIVHIVFTAVLLTSPRRLRFLLRWIRVHSHCITGFFFRWREMGNRQYNESSVSWPPLAYKFAHNWCQYFVLCVKYTYHRRFNQCLELSTGRNEHSRFLQWITIQYIILVGLIFGIWKMHKPKSGTIKSSRHDSERMHNIYFRYYLNSTPFQEYSHCSHSEKN